MLYLPIPCWEDEYCFWYIGHQEDTENSPSISCPVNSSSIYLAIMATPMVEHITAEFCQTSYWIQDGILTVKEHDMTVVSSTPLASPVKLSYDDFNATSFQTILWKGQLRGDSSIICSSNGILSITKITWT